MLKELRFEKEEVQLLRHQVALPGAPPSFDKTEATRALHQAVATLGLRVHKAPS